MQLCKQCGHFFGYARMFFALKKLTCPDCKTQYKVKTDYSFLYYEFLALALAFVYIDEFLGEGKEWLLVVIGISVIFLGGPFYRDITRSR